MAQDLSAVTIQELEVKIKLYQEQKDKVEQAEAEVERLKKEMNNTGQWLQEFMTQHNKTSYKSCYGNLVLTTKFSVSMPKEPEKRDALFGYLKEKGIYDTMITINHQTLNSYYKEEMEAHLNKGELDFTLPGVSEPSAHRTISLRRK